MSNIPTRLKSLFWDTDFSSLQSSDHSHFVIKRVLDRGNTNDVNWLLNKFSKKDIVKTITTSRDLSQKTANFWSDVYNLDKTKILCLQKHHSHIPWGMAS